MFSNTEFAKIKKKYKIWQQNTRKSRAPLHYINEEINWETFRTTESYRTLFRYTALHSLLPKYAQLQKIFFFPIIQCEVQVGRMFETYLSVNYWFLLSRKQGPRNRVLNLKTCIWQCICWVLYTKPEQTELDVHLHQWHYTKLFQFKASEVPLVFPLRFMM